IALCKKYKVSKLWAFGSILTSRFNDESDIDLLVVFDKTRIALLDMADTFFDFIDELEALFGRKVDLTDYSAISNKYFKEEVDENKLLLWSAQ
ncbi:MAG: nucleotidyltransferase domain-containing protein, partial [Duncaniella sp.]|nr:nucleotidyltransferase domain-containing protein [Duncaniella sp.]